MDVNMLDRDPFLGLPPVVVGLTLYLMLSRSGPMGALTLLFTPGAMVLAQAVLATPIITAWSIEQSRSRGRNMAALCA